MENYLLSGLGLDNTFITVPDAAMEQYAYGYGQDSDAPIRVNPGVLDAEAYGMKSSVTDMLRFLDAHLGHGDVAPRITTALTRTRIASYDTAHYAQAMIWEEYAWPVDPMQLAAGNSNEMILTPQPITPRAAPMEGSTFLNKTGSTNGFGAYVAMVPTEDIGVVVLANRRYPNAVRAQVTRSFIEALLSEQAD